MNGARKRPSRRIWIVVALPVGVYLLLEWLFAFMSQAEGLVTPAGRPNMGLIAFGIAYLGVRFFVRWVIPGTVGFLMARGAQRRWLARAQRAPDAPAASELSPSPDEGDERRH